MGRLTTRSLLMDRRWHSNTLTVQSFRRKVRERLAASKQVAWKCDVERCNLWKQSELEVGKLYRIKTSDRFAALENLRDSKVVNKRSFSSFQ
jgi:hypothetical protein